MVKIVRIKNVSILLALLFGPLSLLWCLINFDWPREIYVCIADETVTEESNSIGRNIRDTTQPTSQIKRILRPLSPPQPGNYNFVQEPALYHDGAARCHWSETVGKEIAGIDQEKFTYDFQFLDLANCSTMDECRLICLKTHKLNDPNVCDYLTFSKADKVASLYSIDQTMHWNMTEEKNVVSAMWQCEELLLCDWNWRRHQILKAFKPGEKTDHFIGEFRCKDFGACQRLCETHPTCNYIVSPTNSTRLGASYLYSLPVTRFNIDDYHIDDKHDSFEISCHARQFLTTVAATKTGATTVKTTPSLGSAAATSTAKPLTVRKNLKQRPSTNAGLRKKNNRSRSKRSLDERKFVLQPSLCTLSKWSVDCSKMIMLYDIRDKNNRCLRVNLDRFDTWFLDRLHLVLSFDKASINDGGDSNFSLFVRDEKRKILYTSYANEKSSCENRCLDEIADRQCVCENKYSACRWSKFYMKCLDSLKFDNSMSKCVRKCVQKEMLLVAKRSDQDSSVLHVTISKVKGVTSNIWIFFFVSLSFCCFLIFVSASFYLTFGKD